MARPLRNKLSEVFHRRGAGEAGNKQKDEVILQKGVDFKACKAVAAKAEHSFEHRKAGRNILKAENYPAEKGDKQQIDVRHP